MKALGYYNGAFGPLEEMNVPMTDRAVYYGDGVYEATVVRNGVIYALDAHIDRIFRSAGYLRIIPPMDKAEMKKELYRMVEQMDAGVYILYWQISRGTGRRAHPFPEGKANLMLMLTPYTLPKLSENVSCITKEDTRFLHCNIKTINLIPSIMAMQEAKEAGCYEAILHRSSRVTECSKSNCHILKDGVLITAPADHLILSGIARMHLIEACEALGIPVEEREYTVSDLKNADEIMTTSSTSFLRRVTGVDGESLAGKNEDLIRLLQKTIMDRFYAETGI